MSVDQFFHIYYFLEYDVKLYNKIVNSFNMFHWSKNVGC